LLIFLSSIVQDNTSGGLACEFLKTEEEYGVYLWHNVVVPAISRVLVIERNSEGMNGNLARWMRDIGDLLGRILLVCLLILGFQLITLFVRRS
jgi:hypothetical protein